MLDYLVVFFDKVLINVASITAFIFSSGYENVNQRVDGHDEIDMKLFFNRSDD